MAEKDVRAKKILTVVRPILASIVKISGKDVPWGKGGVPELSGVDALLGEGDADLGRHLRGYYTVLSALRNQAAGQIKWGKGDIPELEYMDSTLAGLYAFISDYVLHFETEESDSGD